MSDKLTVQRFLTFEYETAKSKIEDNALFGFIYKDRSQLINKLKK